MPTTPIDLAHRRRLDSYTVRQDIADRLGKPRSTDFHLAEGIVSVTTVDGRTGWLTSTTNAGFNGITCTIVYPEGRVHGISMGLISTWSTNR